MSNPSKPRWTHRKSLQCTRKHQESPPKSKNQRKNTTILSPCPFSRLSSELTTTQLHYTASVDFLFDPLSTFNVVFITFSMNTVTQSCTSKSYKVVVDH